MNTQNPRYNRKQKGNAGEEAAVQYLISQSYEIVERNWRCRSGEIDIIAMNSGSLVFVEVRSRSRGILQGTAEESVTASKIRQVRSVAEFYLYTKHQTDTSITFDVITVILDNDLSVLSLNHIKEAF